MSSGHESTGRLFSSLSGAMKACLARMNPPMEWDFQTLSVQTLTAEVNCDIDKSFLWFNKYFSSFGQNLHIGASL